MHGKQEGIVPQPQVYTPPGHYSSLKYKEIRLVKLLPTASGSSVNCQIYHATLEVGQQRRMKPPRYLALSYVWGDAANTMKIGIDGCYLYVTQNLHHMLSVFGRGGIDYKKYYLWIDAICINQKNADEKAKQVGRMSEIYALADDVICWLSPRTCTIRDPLFSLSCETCSIFKILQSLASEATDHENPMPLWNDVKHGFMRVVDNPWFTRVWTLQECTINQRGTMQIGKHHHMPINIFLKGCFKAWDYWNLPRELPIYQILGSIESIRDRRIRLGPRIAFGDGYAETIMMLLQASSNRNCSVPQDQLYGVFGLLNSMHHAPDKIRPNYGKTFERVCYDYAIEAFGHSPYSMKCLAYERNELQGDVPSWVPDFRYIGNIDLSQQVRDGNARLSSNNRQLVFDGFYIGACVYSLDAAAEFEHLKTMRPQDPDSPATDRLIERIDEFERNILFPAAAYANIHPGELLVNWLSLQLSDSFYIDDCLLTWLTLAHWLPVTASQESQHASSAELRAAASSTTLSEPVYQTLLTLLKAGFLVLDNGIIGKAVNRSASVLPGDIACHCNITGSQLILRSRSVEVIIEDFDNQLESTDTFTFVSAAILGPESWKPQGNEPQETQGVNLSLKQSTRTFVVV
ncbi:ankyrin and HET domain-containing protein [Apiospora marii]|uniref:Ankyrin and HET domain-containing protein n=1 Tax=Apiospora marii TaxID=335849 RepID=A0ABR1R297_9PEZI